MCGYIETLTDPSYYGQIVLQTFPLIGNYGIIEADFEGPCCVRGYVVREWCDFPSNFRCQYDLDKFLKDKNVVGLCGIDTRQVTRIIREHGVMNAAICDSVPEDLSFIKNYKIKDAVLSVSRKEKTDYPAENEKYRATLIDYGAKNYIKNPCRCAVAALQWFQQPYRRRKSSRTVPTPCAAQRSRRPGRKQVPDRAA